MKYFLTVSPKNAKRILCRIFGDTFAKTVLRSIIGAAIGGLLLLMLAAVLSPGEKISELFIELTPLRIAIFFAAWTISYANLGFLIGWGVAHWRFQKRPRGLGPFWLGSSISGILAYSSLFAMLLLTTESEVEIQPITLSGTIFPVVSFVVATALFGTIAALFFRYVLNFTPLARGREDCEQNCNFKK